MSLRLIDAINYTDYTVYLQQDMKLYGENGNSATWNQKVWGGTNQIHNKSKWYVAECRSKRKQEEEDQTFIMSFTHHTRATPEDLVGCSFFVSVDTFCLGSVLNSCPAMASKEKMRIAVEAGITHQVEAESDSVICVDLLKLTATYFCEMTLRASYWKCYRSICTKVDFESSRFSKADLKLYGLYDI